MRRIVTAVMGTLSGLALLFSYHTSTNQAAEPAALPESGGRSNSVPPDDSTTPDDSMTPDDSTTPDDGAATTASGSSGTFTGDAVDTRWGVVQVAITVEDGRITTVRAVQYPQGNHRDVEINDYALPQLEQEVLQAQSAWIDAVSGATVTSDGYVRSLQSAIDQAHLS